MNMSFESGSGSGDSSSVTLDMCNNDVLLGWGEMLSCNCMSS